MTSDNQSVFARCLELARLDIDALQLTGLDASEAPVVRKHPGDKSKLRRGITIYPGDPVEGLGTNERDDIGYPARVALLKAGNMSLLDDIDRQLYWKERIRRHFSRRRPTDLSLDGACVLECRVEDGEPFEPRLFENALDASYLTIWFWVRESRDY